MLCFFSFRHWRLKLVAWRLVVYVCEGRVPRGMCSVHLPGRPADTNRLSVCISKQSNSSPAVCCDVMDSDVCIGRSQLTSPLTAAAIATGFAACCTGGASYCCRGRPSELPVRLRPVACCLPLRWYVDCSVATGKVEGTAARQPVSGSSSLTQ